jgi:hypothetical protein
MATKAAKKKRLTLASALIKEMKLQKATRAWAGDPDLCIGAYLRVPGGKVQHPLNRIKAVLDAARRSPLFTQEGFIRACDITGTREILHPCFVLAADAQQSKKGVDRKAPRP